MNRMQGADYLGRPTTLGGDLLSATLPMTGGSIYDVMKNDPNKARAAAISAAMMFGVGGNTQVPRP